MTKLKNTKKGMAKKALSISLVAAMLATSNVPVWAAEDLFSDGSAAVEAPAVEEPTAEVDTFSAEEVVPAVEESESSAEMLGTVVNEGDIKVDLEAKKSVVWGENIEVTGSIMKGTENLNKWSYAWKNADGIAVDFGEITDGDVSKMKLATSKDYAGQTLTLWIYRDDADAKFNINTQLAVKIEKKDIASVTTTSELTYNGFSQSLTGAKLDVKDADGATISANDYTANSTSATNAGEKVTVTVTAKDSSAYKGTATVEKTIKARPFNTNDFVASVKPGLEYQYTGKVITIPTEDVIFTESKSSNNGADKKLSGADLSSAITEVKTDNTVAGASVVNITVDTSKLKNFDFSGAASYTFTTKEKVTITKRDLASSCTVTTKSDIPVNTSLSKVGSYLKFMDGTTELNLAQGTDYVVTAKYEDGTSATSLNKTGNYELTITAMGSNTKNSTTINVYVAESVITSVSGSTFNSYTKYYDGTAQEPGKDKIGELRITYKDRSNTERTIRLQSSEWEIIGYTNNTEASIYKNGTTAAATSPAYVEISIVNGIFEGQQVRLPFTIKPLTVTSRDITVPSSISYNEKLKDAEDYNVPVTVVAKGDSGKIVKTLSAEDFTVKYVFENKSGVELEENGNTLHNYIRPTITITNPNYIWGTTDGKTYTMKSAYKTELVAKALSDSMITVNPSSYTYTGGTITPEFAVTDGIYVLYQDEDYKIDSITDAVEVGTGKITIKGINDKYSGTASATFEITPANTSSVKVEIKDQQYTGRKIYPKYEDFSVTLNGNDVSSQFEITGYGENTEVGKGTVTLSPVEGNKNFTGDSITVEFNIVSELVKGTLKVYDEYGIEVTPSTTNAFTFDGTEKTFAKELLSNLYKTDADGKVSQTTKADAEDFEIKYVDNVAGNYVNGRNVAYVYAIAKEGTGYAGWDTITTSDGTVIKGVVAKKAFYINSVKFVEQNVTVKNATYAGGLPVKPEVLIQIGGNTLVEGKDYSIKLIGATAENPYTEVTNSKPFKVEITGKGGYSGSVVKDKDSLKWGIDKKDLKDCTVTVKDGVTTVMNGAIPVPSTEYTVKENDDKTYTVTANSTSKNYTGSQTVVAEGQKPEEGPEAPVISEVKVVGNKATVVLSGESDGATGYDYVISTVNNYTDGRLPNGINKNQLSTETSYQYLDQGIYYAYCHAWKRVNGVKVFSEWSNIYPFAVNTITPEKPVITKLEKSSNGKHLRVTWTKSANATGYDVVMGTKVQKVNGEYRPVEYGKAVKKVTNGDTVSVIFYNIPKGTYYVGLHAYNRTSETGVKVFSPWSNSKKVTF